MRGEGKSETRIPKAEGNPKPESRNPKARRCCLGIWLLRLSDFRRLLCLTSLLVALFPMISHAAAAAAAAAAFESANKLYEEGKFADAASAYEKMGQSGETSAALFFNLGNAFFKSGQIGRAIAAYRTAEQIAPRDPDLRANLQFARNQTPAPTLSPGRWQRWLGRLTLNEWTLLAAVAVWLWLILLAVLQWRPALRPALRSYVISLALLAGFLCACTVATLRETRYTRTAMSPPARRWCAMGRWPNPPPPSLFTMARNCGFWIKRTNGCKSAPAPAESVGSAVTRLSLPVNDFSCGTLPHRSTKSNYQRLARGDHHRLSQGNYHCPRVEAERALGRLASAFHLHLFWGGG